VTLCNHVTILMALYQIKPKTQHALCTTTESQSFAHSHIPGTVPIVYKGGNSSSLILQGLFRSRAGFFKVHQRVSTGRDGLSLVIPLGTPCSTVSEGVALIAWSDGGAVLLDMSCLLANKTRTNDSARITDVPHLLAPLARADGLPFALRVAGGRGVGRERGRIGVQGADLVGSGGHFVFFFVFFFWSLWGVMLRLPEAWWTGGLGEVGGLYSCDWPGSRIFGVDVKLCRYLLEVAECETGISTGTRSLQGDRYSKNSKTGLKLPLSAPGGSWCLQLSKSVPVPRACRFSGQKRSRCEKAPALLSLV
jgi:hypothetical protein